MRRVAGAWACIALALLSTSCMHQSQSFPRVDPAQGVWRFAVAGDSRNCGDVVMPLIAQGARRHQVDFYWHLGDFRHMTEVDEDLQQQYHGTLPLDDYRRNAWGDFIASQIVPFGALPVYLGIGNHELYKDTDRDQSRADYVAQFAYWLDAPALRAQRRLDDPNDPSLRTYYHWKQGGVDFVYLDNASEAGFEPAQIQWFERVLAADRSDPHVRALVVGMHRALPNSLACGHSMNGDHNNENPASLSSGRRVYQALLEWRDGAGKPAYVLASHSHFFMEEIFDTPYWTKRGVLPGWIVGTAGARRYPLPEHLPSGIHAKEFVYGYLLGTVAADGTVRFDFEELTEGDVLPETIAQYGQPFIETCFRENAYRVKPALPPDSCFEQ